MALWKARGGEISAILLSGKADRLSGLVLGPAREQRLTNESGSRAEAEGRAIVMSMETAAAD